MTYSKRFVRLSELSEKLKDRILERAEKEFTTAWVVGGLWEPDYGDRQPGKRLGLNLYLFDGNPQTCLLGLHVSVAHYNEEGKWQGIHFTESTRVFLPYRIPPAEVYMQAEEEALNMMRRLLSREPIQ